MLRSISVTNGYSKNRASAGGGVKGADDLVSCASDQETGFPWGGNDAAIVGPGGRSLSMFLHIRLRHEVMLRRHVSASMRSISLSDAQTKVSLRVAKDSKRVSIGRGGLSVGEGSHFATAAHSLRRASSSRLGLGRKPQWTGISLVMESSIDRS